MIERRSLIACGASALALSALPASAEVKTSGVKMIAVPGGNVWTKRIGRGPVKMLLLHGGPGFSHDYLECFEDVLPPAGIEMYYYDQLGCGNSDHPNDDKLWTWADLPKIKVPTLVMGAKYDEMDPDQMRREGKLIPGAKTWISERGSHLCMYDDQDAYFAALVPFLKGQG